MSTRPEKTWTIDSYTSGYRGLTRDTLHAFKAAEKAWIDARRSEILIRRHEACELVRHLENSGFFSKKVGRLVFSTKVMEFYNGQRTPGESYTAPEEKWLDDQERKAHDEMVTQNIAAYRDKAICWLIDKGYKYGVDFNSEDAVDVSDQLAFDEEVSIRKGPEGGPTWYDFDGNNCDRPCLGWNGVDHRCQCGNRRVSWVQDECHTFERPVIRAVSDSKALGWE